MHAKRTSAILKRRPLRLTIVAAAALLLAAALAAGGRLWLRDGASRPAAEAAPREYEGTFPGIRDALGVFSTSGDGSECRDFRVGHSGEEWLRAEHARFSDGGLELRGAATDLRKAANLAAWSGGLSDAGALNLITGTCADGRRLRVEGEHWVLDGGGRVTEFDCRTLTEIIAAEPGTNPDIPEFPHPTPAAPGGGAIRYERRLPGNDIARISFQSDDWTLLIREDGQWLLNHNIPVRLPEFPDVLLRRAAVSGGGRDELVRWSGNFATLGGHPIFEAVAGGGQAGKFTAFGPWGEKNDWEFTAENLDAPLDFRNARMVPESCVLRISGGKPSGELKLREFKMPLAGFGGSLLCRDSELAFDGGSFSVSVAADGFAAAENFLGSFELTGCRFQLDDSGRTVCAGDSGRLGAAGWLGFRFDSASDEGRAEEFYAAAEDLIFRAAAVEFRFNDSGCELLFKDCTASGCGFSLSGISVRAAVNGDGGISGRLEHGIVTGDLLPGVGLSEAVIDFSGPDAGAPSGWHAELKGRVNIFGRDGVFSCVRAPEHGEWRGRLDFATAALPAVMTVWSRENYGWVIPLPGAGGDFPAALFPEWRDVSVSGTGFMECEKNGCRLNLINAECSLSGFTLGGAKGVWPLNRPSSPEGDEVFDLEFASSGISGAGPGSIRGRCLSASPRVESMNFGWLGGQAGYIGSSGRGWVFALEAVPGGELAEALFGERPPADWRTASFSGTGILDPESGRWRKLDLTGSPAESGGHRTAMNETAEKLGNGFFGAFLRDFYADGWRAGYDDRTPETIVVGVSGRPAETLDFTISGDPGEMFIPATGDDPGFSGNIDFDIDLPLEGSGGILSPGSAE